MLKVTDRQLTKAQMKAIMASEEGPGSTCGHFGDVCITEAALNCCNGFVCQYDNTCTFYTP